MTDLRLVGRDVANRICSEVEALFDDLDDQEKRNATVTRVQVSVWTCVVHRREKENMWRHYRSLIHLSDEYKKRPDEVKRARLRDELLALADQIRLGARETLWAEAWAKDLEAKGAALRTQHEEKIMLQALTRIKDDGGNASDLLPPTGKISQADILDVAARTQVVVPVPTDWLKAAFRPEPLRDYSAGLLWSYVENVLGDPAFTPRRPVTEPHLVMVQKSINTAFEGTDSENMKLLLEQLRFFGDCYWKLDENRTATELWEGILRTTWQIQDEVTRRQLVRIKLLDDIKLDIKYPRETAHALVWDYERK